LDSRALAVEQSAAAAAPPGRGAMNVDSRTSRRVVLFLPPYDGGTLGPPLGLLSLAGALRQSGYEPLVIDGSLVPDYRRRVRDAVQDCLCFGVSLLTGPMILDAIEISRAVKKERPDLPVIFGGWHPTLRTAETLREPFVDIVVRRQGEATLIELLDRLKCGRSLDLIPGCWFKRDGRIIENPDRPTVPIASVPAPAYDLADLDAYERVTGQRKLPYATSIGCPYACNYCTDMVFYNRRFNAYSADHVVSELAALAQKLRLTDVALVDSNFLVDVRRAVQIAAGILESGARFRWTFQASTDLLCRMSDDEVKLLADSGVRHIGFGTESASPEVLRNMNKAHQHVKDMYTAAEKCARAGIRVTYNLIFGYPGEEDRQRNETLRVMARIARRYDNVTFSPNLFTPYPGIPIWPELRSMGVAEPATLAGWARVDLNWNKLPWLRGGALHSLNRAVQYLMLMNRASAAGSVLRPWPVRRMLGLARQLLSWRVEHACFGTPVELWLLMARRWLVMRRSLLTGQPLGRTFAMDDEVCST
jgi:anaerobic magnesium-protoporphyrin IX monomethyl ester cyclase